MLGYQVSSCRPWKEFNSKRQFITNSLNSLSTVVRQLEVKKKPVVTVGGITLSTELRQLEVQKLCVGWYVTAAGRGCSTDTW
jgi:hypothetical protein